MLVVVQPIMALLCPQPGAPKRYSFDWVCWAVGMSAWILAVATVFLGGGCRHRSGVDERTLGRPDPGGGCRLLGMDERYLGLPDPGRGCKHRSNCLSQETLSTKFQWLTWFSGISSRLCLKSTTAPKHQPGWSTRFLNNRQT